ncbi:MAG: MFS transporter [Pseudomonadota bacterium]
MSLVFGTRQPCDDRGQKLATAPCAGRDKPWVLGIAVLGSSLAFIEGSIVNLALPALQADLDLDSLALQWVVNSYLLTLSALLLIGGAAGDRYGLRRVFVTGLILFGVTSAACGLANSLTSLVAWRGLQGVGSALLVPASLALINVHFEPGERARAIGIWAGASALTTALGPLAGGALVDFLGWRAVFLGIAPLAGLTALLALWRIPASNSDASQSLDWPGAILLAAALGLLTFGLIESGARSGTMLLLGAAALAGFLGYEARAASPMLPLALFRRQSFSGANAMTMVLYFALGGALYFVPFNLIQIQGYSALAAGAAFLPLTLMLGLGSALAGEQLKRHTPRVLLSVGALITSAGFALLTLPGATSTYLLHWLPGIAVIGFGMTLCVAPLTTVVMASVDNSQSGVASGVNNTAARLAGLLAIALLTGLGVRLFASDLTAALDTIQLAPAVRDALLANAHALAELKPPAATADAAGVRALIEQSYVATFRKLMLLCSILALLASALAWLSLGSAGKQVEASAA